MNNRYTFPQVSDLTIDERNRLSNLSRSCILWLTGLSGSGKSTIAIKLEKYLATQNIRTFILDGDNIRFGLNKDLGFSLDDRKENIRRAGEVSKLFLEAGILTIATFISPLREFRDMVRSMHNQGDFIEVYIKCPLEICESRDPKGLYKYARAGRIKDFTGISSDYEAPLSPDIIIDTSENDANKSVEALVKFLTDNHYIS
ncbi:adenylyl-sulfate kinase [Paenibacillus illinoisensis]|uniref:adenylyl-sulfate kinase n=1 Tax=Paenibacillus illinoisensis TaxID=59845 RepID=UPI0030191123